MKTSFLDFLLGGDQAAKPKDHMGLVELKAKISGLSTFSASSSSGVLTFGGGVSQAHTNIEIICRNIDDTIEALKTGLDPHGNPITNREISQGLKALIQETRKPAFTGLMASVLGGVGSQLLQGHMYELERIADEIARGAQRQGLNLGFIVGLITGAAGGFGFSVVYLINILLRLIFPILDNQYLTVISIITFPVAIVAGYFCLRVANKVLIKRGTHGLGYRGSGSSRVVQGFFGVAIGASFFFCCIAPIMFGFVPLGIAQ
jgi:hypothetical protein